MTDRPRKLSYENAGYLSGKMVNVNDLSPRKTMLVLVIVVGCFAVLWPKVFYPMLVGSANNRIKPSAIDRTQGCCDVISEKDVNTLKLMSEICDTIIKSDSDKPMSNKELLRKCQNLILDTCRIDISAVLQEQVRLGHTTKQILDDVRSLNGSLCLKYNFGIAPWKLGVPHRVNVRVAPYSSIRQERPLHLRSEMVHPAFRERGRAIPQAEFAPTKPAPPSRLIPKIVEGRPGPIPGMRPTIGGAGHVVPAKQGGTSMGLIMPIYTIGIVIFFTYTVMKIVFKKQPEVLYPPLNPDPHFRREVFEADRGHLSSRSKEGSSSKLVVNAMSALLDEVDLELSSRRKASEVIQEEVVANGSLLSQEDDQSSVQVLGMETTASRENGQKWTRSGSPLVPAAHVLSTPPQEIFLEGSLPPQSHLLVTDSATEAQKVDAEEDPAVVLAGKMTLSVISLDSSENGTDESSNSGKKNDDRSSSNVSEEFEKIDMAQLEEQIDNIIAEAESVNNEETEIELLCKPDESSQFVAHEVEECLKQTASVVDSGYTETDQRPVEDKDSGSKGDIVEAKQESSLTSDEAFKEERNLIKIEKDQERVDVLEYNLPEAREVKEIIDEIKEEYVIEEVIIPAAKELDKNYEQQQEIKESHNLDSGASAAIADSEKDIHKKALDSFKIEPKLDKDKLTDLEQTARDLVEPIAEKIHEETIEHLDSTSIKPSNEDILPLDKSDIERQEKNKTDSILQKEEVAEEPADVEDVGEVEDEDYVLESEEEEDEEENEDLVLKDEFKPEGTLKETSQLHQEEEEDDNEVECDEEYEEESEEENGEEIEQEVIEYISDEEEEVEEVDEEEEEEVEDGDDDQKVISHV